MTDTTLDEDFVAAVARLSRDLREAARTMTSAEARFLVDSYYGMQKQRITQGNRARAMSGEPHDVISWLGDQSGVLEKQVQAALDQYSRSHLMGPWIRGVVGVGPVIAAGLLAHVDIRKAPTVGHIWRFAGLDPTLVWGKGQKRPYNGALKVLCWKLGESFKKFSNHPNCVYGKVYRERKELEVRRSETGLHAEQAARDLAERGQRMTAEQRAHYEAGRLPPGRLDLRACRYAVKHFLADLHGAWYRAELGEEPPLPYPIAILGHAHLRPPLHGGTAAGA